MKKIIFITAFILLALTSGAWSTKPIYITVTGDTINLSHRDSAYIYYDNDTVWLCVKNNCYDIPITNIARADTSDYSDTSGYSSVAELSLDSNYVTISIRDTFFIGDSAVSKMYQGVIIDSNTIEKMIGTGITIGIKTDSTWKWIAIDSLFFGGNGDVRHVTYDYSNKVYKFYDNNQSEDGAIGAGRYVYTEYGDNTYWWEITDGYLRLKLDGVDHAQWRKNFGLTLMNGNKLGIRHEYSQDAACIDFDGTASTGLSGSDTALYFLVDEVTRKIQIYIDSSMFRHFGDSALFDGIMCVAGSSYFNGNVILNNNDITNVNKIEQDLSSFNDDSAAIYFEEVGDGTDTLHIINYTGVVKIGNNSLIIDTAGNAYLNNNRLLDSIAVMDSINNNSGGGGSTDDSSWVNVEVQQVQWDTTTYTGTGTINLDMSYAIHFIEIGAGNIILDYSSAEIGTYVFHIKQDATGGRTVGYSSGEWQSTNGSITIDMDADDITILTGFYNGQKMIITETTNLEDR